MWSEAEEMGFEQFYTEVKRMKSLFERPDYEFGPGLKSEVTNGYSWEN
jgi:hypothetical protein